jgi:hypothetical protein
MVITDPDRQTVDPVKAGRSGERNPHRQPALVALGARRIMPGPGPLGWCVVQKAVLVLRGYWSAVLLGLAAVALLALAAPAKAALAGAGFAFIGAAVTRGIDLAKERRTEAAQADFGRRRDLDETRRLAYMPLYASGSRAPELVATLVNALAHHQSAVDPQLAATHIATIMKGGESGDYRQSVQWLKEQIGQITAELDT